MPTSNNRLLQLYNEGQRDFHGWNLAGCDLNHLALSDIDLSYANLSHADLTGTDLRWSELRSAPVMGKRPTYHDNDYIFANCMLIACAAQGGDVDGLSHAILQAHWRDDADLADHKLLFALAEQTGHDGEALQSAAATPEIQETQEANTQEAIARNLFGSPTYFVDGDMFYGQDHLDLVERALTTPFAGTWP